MNLNYVVMPLIFFAAGAVIIGLSIRRMFSLSRNTYATWRKVVERSLLSLVILIVVAVVGTTSLNAILVHHYWSHHPAPGKIVDVDGYRMHIHCTGSGSPALILEAGGQSDSVIWAGVQPELAKTTTVCSYDRAGFGWSDTRPGPRDADHIAAELHSLLLKTGISGPIVLMGHSVGGMFVRDYATHYPDNIAGLVFLDSSTPFQERNPAMGKVTAPPPAWVFNLALVAGVPRLLGMCPVAQGSELRKEQGEDICRLRQTAFDELIDFDQSSEQTLHSGPYGTLPILVISRDLSRQLPGNPPSKEEQGRRNAWNQMQENLKKLSTRSRRIIAATSSHQIANDRPDLIEKEVPVFIEQIRGSAPQPVDYGSTTTE
jgi:pimeloyl-ACP methyl ester carboxylesterase